MKKSWKRFGILLAVLSLIAGIIGGCQVIGSVDLNKALLSSFDIQSMEGKGSIEVALDFDQAAVAEGGEEAALIAAFSKIKLNLEQVKQESTQVVSVKGSLELPKGAIPFSAYISPEELTILPEGATKPFTLPLAEMYDQMSEEAGADANLDWLFEFQDKAKDPAYLKPYYSYLVGKLPNPSKLTVNSGTETINGENVFLHHVQAEVAGKDLLPLARTFILNLMKDDQALKEVIALYYDVIQGALTSFIPEDAELDGEFGSILVGLRSILDDKEAGVEVVHTEVKQVLAILLTLLEGHGTELVSSLGDQSSLKVDLYVDNSMKIRKSAADFVLAPGDTEDSPLKSIRVKSSFENWNVNGAVKADTISTANALSLLDLSEPAEVLDSLKPDSVLYKVLKDDLHIARKTGYFYVMPKERLDEHTSGWAAFSDNGVTMAPARSLAANLDLELNWDESSQSVTLTTADKKKSIKLTDGSDTAVVNGAEKLALERPAAVVQGAFYVPLRDVAEALGAVIQWEPESSSIIVELD